MQLSAAIRSKKEEQSRSSLKSRHAHDSPRLPRVTCTSDLYAQRYSISWLLELPVDNLFYALRTQTRFGHALRIREMDLIVQCSAEVD